MHRIILSIVLLGTALPLAAQTDRATLTGVIMDPSQRVIQGAKVNLLATATGINHATVTNSGGVYTFSALSVGQYTVSVAAAGFAVARIESFSLEVGETRTLNVKLQVGAVSSSVTVLAAAPDLNLSSAVVGGVITGKQTEDLPVNGRYWATLESQIPGAISSGSGTQDTIRFSGLSQEDNNFRLDGVDATGINHAFVKEPLVVQLPMESIAEFRGSSALYSADVGGMAGGQISMVSKSGSNQFHGSFYEYLRNSFFDAKAFTATSVSPFRLNNFGVSSGGPIIHDKLFYFANYEAVRQAFDTLESGYVPTDAYRAEVAAASPVLAPLIDAFPEGNRTTNDPNALLWVIGAPNPTKEDGGLARVDYAMNAKTSVSLRFNTDSYTNTSPGLAENTITTVSTPNALVDVVYRFSPTILNDAKVGYNRDEYQDVGSGGTSIYSLTISPNFSYSLGDHSFRHDDTYSFLDDADFYRGRHTIKTGAEIRHLEENKLHPLVEQSLSYLSENNFANNVLDEYTYKPLGVETAARMTTYFGYILDEVKIRPNLTVNAGLRYEYYGVDHDKNPNIGQVFDPFTCGLQYCAPGAPFYYPNTLDFEPRISIGWAPDLLHNRTAIRLGFGTFFDNGQFGGLYAAQTQIGQSFSLSQVNTPGLSYPVTPYLGAAVSNVSYSASDQHRKDLDMNEWTVSVQHELARDTIVSMTYVGSRGEHLFNNSILLNGINPATGTRPYASLTSATIGWHTNGDNSSYNALQIGLKRNLHRGFLLSANYQYSHAISDGSNGGGESDGLENNNCRKCEIASTDFDVRQNVSGSGIWILPFGKGHAFLASAPHVVNGFLGGWQFSGILLARTGVPLNVSISRSASALPDGINKNQRPDRVPGAPLYPSHQTASLWLNPAAFTTPAKGAWGDASRNAVRAPGIWQADTGLEKVFPVREAMNFSFRWDVFNVFNRDQIGNPATTWAPGSGTFGQITSPYTTNAVGTGTPRQMQFSLRFSY
ncbi:MAG TPA: TonB-dependent receptor [Acidobacteriaceae bacterium]|jgi:hypothetical protein|nr:TonB-dependent receptor [Acidobacteriaceae bacterium]